MPLKEHQKITVGYVSQIYTTLPNGSMICTGQEFIAGDQVDYEDMESAAIEVDTDKEVYCPMEMVQPKQIRTDGVKFVCPKSGDIHLECVMDGCHECEVLNIAADGDFDFGNAAEGDECDRFQCLKCGFTLKSDEKVSGGYAEYNIIDHIEVVEWCKKNCKQD